VRKSQKHLTKHNLTGHQVSEGTLDNTQQVLYTQLEPFETAAQKAVIASPVVHFDGIQTFGFHRLSKQK
jgi:hypothetical protein